MTRLKLLFDGAFETSDDGLRSSDPLQFVDKQPYRDRLRATQAATQRSDALVSAAGTLDGREVEICAMEYAFIGGSMGSVVGEKIARSIDRCLKKRCPLIIVSASGGARMQEGAISLMQMAKISAGLMQLDEAKLPYISVLTDPTTGGVTASYAMLGDLNIAEPGALIGFAGPRVIEQTIRKSLPEGFQRSEFLLKHGMLDAVVPRLEMKAYIATALKFFV
jgi:acetyl-CoA carboxylase carboxyl transferase subunit beta